MWKNDVEWGRPQMTVWRMRIACWTLKATDTRTRTGCVILTAVTLHQRLHERASTSRHTDAACLVIPQQRTAIKICAYDLRHVTSKEPQNEMLLGVQTGEFCCTVSSHTNLVKTGHLTCTFTGVTASISTLIRIPFRAKTAGGR